MTFHCQTNLLLGIRLKKNHFLQRWEKSRNNYFNKMWLINVTTSIHKVFKKIFYKGEMFFSLCKDNSILLLIF